MAEDTLELKFDTKAIEAALQALPKKLQKQYTQQAMEAGGKVILEALVALTPENQSEPTPDSNSLPPGVMKYDMQVEVIATGQSNPKVRIGPTEVTGHVVRWINDGWTFTGHGKNKARRKKIRTIEGTHFIESAFDEAADKAVDAILESLATALGNDTTPGSENE